MTQRIKQDLRYVWKESKPHLFRALVFLSGVLIQPHKWKQKYAKLDGKEKEAVQIGLTLLGFSITVLLVLKWLLF